MHARITRFVLLLSLAAASLAAAPAVAGANPHAPNFDRLVADSGFRPEANGFAFANYGEGLAGLSSVEMQRLFGSVACASPREKDGKCPLTPPAREWMDQINDDMEGGHCYGFSTLSLRFHSGQIRPQEFVEQAPPATTVPALKLLGTGSAVHTGLIREIAYSFSHQYLPSVADARVTGTPVQVLDRLIQELPAATERYTVMIFRRDPDQRDGHAVTPFAVEELGEGKFAILVYDNNYPRETRAVIVDRTRNTWNYNGAPNAQTEPFVYEGDATTRLAEGTLTLFLNPTSPGLGVQPCAFCDDPGPPERSPVPAPGSPAPPAPGPATPAVQVSASGPPRKNADVLIRSKRGFVGKRRGRLVKRLRGARIRHPADRAGLESSHEPHYSVPAGDAYTVTLDNTAANARGVEGLSIAGPGFQAAIDDIRQRRGQVVRMNVSADGSRLSFSSNRPIDSPQVRIGLEEDGADHAFTLERRGRLRAGEKLVFDLSERSDELSIQGADGRYDLVMRYVDAQGERVFAKENVSTAGLTEGRSGEATLDFGGFDGDAADDVHLEGDRGERRSFDTNVKPTAEHDEVAEDLTE